MCLVSLGRSGWEGGCCHPRSLLSFVHVVLLFLMETGLVLAFGKVVEKKEKGVQYSEETLACMKKSLGHCKLRVASFIFLFIMQSIIYMPRSFSFLLLPFSVVLYLRCIMSL